MTSRRCLGLLGTTTLSFATVLFACSSDDSSGGTPNDGNADASATPDGGASTANDASPLPADGGTTEKDSGSATTCPQKDAPLPAASVTIDGVPYYPVLESSLGTTIYRKQVNFGTAEQFHKCPEEPGQNSTFALQITMQTKPTATGSYNYTSSRGPTVADAVNLYVSFFRNTGHARADSNFLSPDTGTFTLTVAGTKGTATLSAVTMTREADGAETFPLSGSLELNL